MNAAAVLGDGRDVRVSQVMSRPALTIETDESLWDAWQLLFVSGLRHLVVLDEGGQALGILSDRNILAEVPATAEHLGARLVRDVMARVPLVYVRPTDDPVTAARTMAAGAVDAVPVMEADGRVVGLMTESDIVRWLAS